MQISFVIFHKKKKRYFFKKCLLIQEYSLSQTALVVLSQTALVLAKWKSISSLTFQHRMQSLVLMAYKKFIALIAQELHTPDAQASKHQTSHIYLLTWASGAPRVFYLYSRLRLRKKLKSFPSGIFITGFLIGLVVHYYSFSSLCKSKNQSFYYYPLNGKCITTALLYRSSVSDHLSLFTIHTLIRTFYISLLVPLVLRHRPSPFVPVIYHNK